MKLSGEYVFAAEVQEVWDALFDPAVLAAVLPGCEKLELVDGSYLGELKVKIGPIQGKFTGKVDLLDQVPPASYRMVIDGKGPQGFVKATARIALESQGSTTKITYDSDAQVGGKIATVGERLIETSAKAIVKQSLEGLGENIVIRAEAHRKAKASGELTTSAAAAITGASSSAAPGAATANVSVAEPAAASRVAAPADATASSLAAPAASTTPASSIAGPGTSTPAASSTGSPAAPAEASAGALRAHATATASPGASPAASTSAAAPAGSNPAAMASSVAASPEAQPTDPVAAPSTVAGAPAASVATAAPALAIEYKRADASKMAGAVAKEVAKAYAPIVMIVLLVVAGLIYLIVR